jgi:hypothetical protein
MKAKHNYPMYLFSKSFVDEQLIAYRIVTYFKTPKKTSCEKAIRLLIDCPSGVLTAL